MEDNLTKAQNQGTARAGRRRATGSRSCCRTTPIPTRWRARWRCARCWGATSSPPRFSASRRSRGPENRTMVHLLEIEIAPADTEALADFDRIAMVDVQPPYFNGRLRARRHRDRPSSGLRARQRRLRGRARPGYGATATIMTEYLIARRRADQRAPGDRPALWHPERHPDAVAAGDRQTTSRPSPISIRWPTTTCCGRSTGLSCRCVSPGCWRARWRRLRDPRRARGVASRAGRARRPDRADGGLLPAVRRRGMGGGIGQARRQSGDRGAQSRRPAGATRARWYASCSARSAAPAAIATCPRR